MNQTPTPDPTPRPDTSAPISPDAQRVELLLATLLRAGVVASVLVMLAGIAVSLLRHPDYVTDPGTLRRLTEAGAAFPHTLADLRRELMEGRGRAIVTLGLVLLILTPVARVAVCVAVFIRQRDRAFTVMTAFVLLVIVLSFVLGRVE
jgi:uncharacterized membrane protein